MRLVQLCSAAVYMYGHAVNAVLTCQQCCCPQESPKLPYADHEGIHMHPSLYDIKPREILGGKHHHTDRTVLGGLGGGGGGGFLSFDGGSIGGLSGCDGGGGGCGGG